MHCLESIPLLITCFFVGDLPWEIVNCVKPNRKVVIFEQKAKAIQNERIFIVGILHHLVRKLVSLCQLLRVAIAILIRKSVELVLIPVGYLSRVKIVLKPKATVEAHTGLTTIGHSEIHLLGAELVNKVLVNL